MGEGGGEGEVQLHAMVFSLVPAVIFRLGYSSI